MQVTFLWLLSSAAVAGQLTTNQYGAELHWETEYVPFQLNPSGKHGLDHDEMVLYNRREQTQHTTRYSNVT